MAVKILDDPNLKDWEIFKRHLKDFPITSVRLDFFSKAQIQHQPPLKVLIYYKHKYI